MKRWILCFESGMIYSGYGFKDLRIQLLPTHVIKAYLEINKKKHCQDDF